MSVWLDFSAFILVINYIHCAIPWWETSTAKKVIIAA